MKRALLTFLAVTTLAATSTSLAASQRVDRRDYVGGLVGPNPSCYFVPSSQVGGGCFALTGQETQVKITIQDEFVAGIGGYYKWSPSGNAGLFCGSVTVGMPRGSFSLTVAVGRGANLFGCNGAATKGRITAVFTLP